MKKLVLIMLTLIVSAVCFAYTWVPFGPKGNKLCLFKASQSIYAVICADSGFYFTLDTGMPVWEFIEYPIIDAAPLDDDNILVIAGNGSYSDGVYKFNITSRTFDVVEFCMNPKFITKGGSNSSYFVGYEEGLIESVNGVNWFANSNFDGMCCMDMASYSEYLAIVTDNPTDNVYYSENNGESWMQVQSDVNISQLLLDSNGCLTGICSENTSHCGFYKKNGIQWENVFYTENINALGSDNMGNPFIGWYNSSGEEKGIARYRFDNPNAGLMFLNEGLPDLNIHDIPTSFAYDGNNNIVFCCTDEGVYYCDDFAIGITPLDVTEHVVVYPNPVKNILHINSKKEINNITIYSVLGQEVWQGTAVNIDVSDLLSGMYMLQVNTKKGEKSVTRFIKE